MRSPYRDRICAAAHSCFFVFSLGPGFGVVRLASPKIAFLRQGQSYSVFDSRFWSLSHTYKAGQFSPPRSIDSIRQNMLPYCLYFPLGFGLICRLFSLYSFLIGSLGHLFSGFLCFFRSCHINHSFSRTFCRRFIVFCFLLFQKYPDGK